MYICICNQVTDGQIRHAVRTKGITRLQDVCRELGACNQCGKCAVAVRQVISDCLEPDTVQAARWPSVELDPARRHTVRRRPERYPAQAIVNG